MNVARKLCLQPLRLALVTTLFASSLAVATDWDMPNTHPTDMAPVAFSQISAGSAHTVGLSTAGTVWAWGNNRKKQLGILGLNRVQFPMRVTGGLAGKQVRTVQAAGEHSLALTVDGEVYSWGNTTMGPTLGFDPLIPFTPTRVEGALRNRKVVSISAGEYANYAITEDGELFEWLRDTVDANGVSSTEPVSLLPGHRMVKVVGGTGMAFAIDDRGGLWGWGAGVGPNGELGAPGTRTQPVRVAALEGKAITLLAAGALHVLAGTARGEVFAWGGNTWGQLGTGSAGAETESLVPVQLSRKLFKGKVVKLSADRHASYALTERGQLYAWGWNYSNQLPLPVPAASESVNKPTLVKDALMRGGVIDMDGGFSHGVALARDGSVIAWGSNSVGQLGLGLAVLQPFMPTRAQPVTAPVNLLQPAPSRKVRITYPLRNGETLRQLPTLYGTGAPGRAVIVEVVKGPGSATGSTLCTATINSSGYWSCTVASALEPQQRYAMRAKAFAEGRPVRSAEVWFRTGDY